MNARPRFPFWMILAGSILIVTIVALALMLSTGEGWGEPPRAARAAVLSSGQVAAIQGASLLFDEPAYEFVFLPAVLK